MAESMTQKAANPSATGAGRPSSLETRVRIRVVLFVRLLNLHAPVHGRPEFKLGCYQSVLAAVNLEGFRRARRQGFHGEDSTGSEINFTSLFRIPVADIADFKISGIGFTDVCDAD